MSEEIEYLPQEEIDKANAISQFSNKVYVFYDVDGTILAISRKKGFSDLYIEVDASTVSDFIRAKKNLSLFKIKNPGLSNVSFVEKHNTQENMLGIFFVPTVTTANDVELIIAQDIKNNSWKIRFGNISKNRIDNNNLHQVIKFYVCLKDKPSFLLNTLECTLGQIVNEASFKFVSDYEKHLDLIDIVTIKSLNSYGKMLND